MSSELLEYKYDTLASLYWMPCTVEELSQRDFCKHLPLWYIHTILSGLERAGLLFQRKDGVYKARKIKARIELNKRGYGIDDY